MSKPTYDQLVSQLTRLHDAALAVVESWEQGDLAGAVNNLDGEAEVSLNLLKEVK